MRYLLFLCAFFIAFPVHGASKKKKSLLRSFYHLILPTLSDRNRQNWNRLIDDVENPDQSSRTHYDPPSSQSSSDTHYSPENNVPCSFRDVAGGIPREIVQLLDMLKHTEKYKKFGITPPKGILMVGPPGTGKTLLARALAGEGKYGFFYSSATAFIEVYVGTGPARIRELFNQAKDYSYQHDNQKVIIFIDELDAIGNRSTLAGHDSESRRTLNELLSQMDGFAQNENIIVLAATNNPGDLDPALKRAGRFDTIIDIPLPDKDKRNKVMRFYIDKLPKSSLDTSIDIEAIADGSRGFNNADLKELIRVAGSFAAEENAARLTQRHLELALEKIKHQKRF